MTKVRFILTRNSQTAEVLFDGPNPETGTISITGDESLAAEFRELLDDGAWVMLRDILHDLGPMSDQGELAYTMEIIEGDGLPLVHDEVHP